MSTRSWAFLRPVLLFLTLQLLALNLSGCYQWVPIEPARYTDGQPHTFSRIRVGPEGEYRLTNARLTYPSLSAYQEGQPVLIDLRQTPAYEPRLSKGSRAAIITGCVLGGIALTAGAVAFLAGFGSALGSANAGGY